MRSVNKTFLVILALLLLGISGAFAADKKDAAVDSAVEPTHAGKVIGHIYDAVTGNPLATAVVTLQQEGAFPTEGAAIGNTDATGRYQCETKLGRISKSFDVGRALNSSLIGMVFSGSAMKVTKRVDVSRLIMRVTCDGYRAFEGIVPCRRVDVEGFVATMEPILLTPVTSQEVSTIAPGWGVAQLLDVTVTPTIAHPRDEVTITARVQCPVLPKGAKTGIQMYSAIFGAKTFTTMTTEQNSVLVFTAKYSVPKKAKTASDTITFVLDGCPYDTLAGKDTASQLFQVVNTPDEEKTAQIRAEAYQYEQQGDTARVLARMQTLCATPSAGITDYQRLASLAERTHDSATSIAAYQKIVELTPEKGRMGPRVDYAASLLSGGFAERVITEMVPIIEQVKEKDRPKRVPVALMSTVGLAYLAQNKLTEAEAINTALDKWADAGSHPRAVEFRSSLRLAQAQRAVHADNTNATAWAKYGRELLDAGRTEEAVEKLKKAITLDPTLTSAKNDLQSAMTRLSDAASGTPQNLDADIASAEQQLGDGKTSKDFFAWHRYALLLFRKAWQQQQGTNQASATTLAKTRDALTEALKCGRSGKDTLSEGHNYGYFGYYGSKVVGISGFAYPEGNADFVLLQSIRVIERQPQDYLTYLDMGTALLELKQTDLAGKVIQRCLALKPECVDAKYAAAMVAVQQGENTGAMTKLRDVLKANPRHPYANLALARLYTEAGNQAAASACLAAHAKYYGK